MCYWFLAKERATRVTLPNDFLSPQNTMPLAQPSLSLVSVGT